MVSIYLAAALALHSGMSVVPVVPVVPGMARVFCSLVSAASICACANQMRRGHIYLHA